MVNTESVHGNAASIESEYKLCCWVLTLCWDQLFLDLLNGWLCALLLCHVWDLLLPPAAGCQDKVQIKVVLRCRIRTRSRLCWCSLWVYFSSPSGWGTLNIMKGGSWARPPASSLCVSAYTGPSLEAHVGKTQGPFIPLYMPTWSGRIPGSVAVWCVCVCACVSCKGSSLVRGSGRETGSNFSKAQEDYF